MSGRESAEQFLTIQEAADLARVSPKRLRNLMASRVLVEGVHFNRPPGLGPRFKLRALVAWLDPPASATDDAIPMARGNRGSGRGA